MVSGNDEMRVGFHGQNRVSGQFQSVNASSTGMEGNTNATVSEGDAQIKPSTAQRMTTGLKTNGSRYQKRG